MRRVRRVMQARSPPIFTLPPWICPAALLPARSRPPLPSWPIQEEKPGCLIDLHCGNNLPGTPGNPNTYGHVQPALQFMHLLPYIDSLWFGEGYNYDEPPEYWLVEVPATHPNPSPNPSPNPDPDPDPDPNPDPNPNPNPNPDL